MSIAVKNSYTDMFFLVLQKTTKDTYVPSEFILCLLSYEI